MRIFDCVILSYWGEMRLLEKRFTDDPDVTVVICEVAPAVFPGSELALRMRGKWNHVLVEEDEITGDRQACLQYHLRNACNGGPGDRIVFSDIREGCERRD